MFCQICSLNVLFKSSRLEKENKNDALTNGHIKLEEAVFLTNDYFRYLRFHKSSTSPLDRCDGSFNDTLRVRIPLDIFFNSNIPGLFFFFFVFSM